MGEEKKETKTSVHHLLCKSRGGANTEDNLVRLKQNYHRAIHTLFANQIIAEQLLTTIDISAKALREDVKEWLIETLNSRDIHNPEERYQEGALLLPRKYKK